MADLRSLWMVVMWAHSAKHGQRHRLEDHLIGTAELAAKFASSFGGQEMAYWLGLAHDCGKASQAWQQGLLRAEHSSSKVGVDHKSLGVRIALDANCREAAFALHGHHGGLSDRQELGICVDKNDNMAGNIRWDQATAALESTFPQIFAGPPLLPEGFTDPGAIDFLVRFLYSCLVDADGLDTQAHHMGWTKAYAGEPFDAAALCNRLESRRRLFLEMRPASDVDVWREAVFDSAVAAAEKPGGIFRLTAPTGAGKTIAAAAFALRHAMAHGKSRVIVAVPYITITEQNAQVYRDLLDPAGGGPPVVLEQHSQVDLDGLSPAHRWQRFAAENWDAPFVVTTTIQLFESLFGRKPSRMRKVHRLAGAVIVLDEVQTLPHALLPQIADAFRLLTTHFGATILLSSATQPELSAFGPLKDIEASEVVADPKPMFAALRRVRYQWWNEPRPTLADVATKAAEEPQVLVVVNAVKDARSVFEKASLQRQGLVVHLSTAMCPAHRRQVLCRVRRSLKADEPVFLVSTQLIEAGVDLDFPVVFRAVAPPDSVQQAAGRANREGRLGPEGGLVVVVDPSDGGMPGAYSTQIGQAKAHIGENLADPDDLDALSAYFRDLYRSLNLVGEGSRSSEIRENRERQNFQAVTDGPDTMGKRDRSKAFRMIDEDTVPVVVPFHDDVFDQQWIDDLRTAVAPDRRMFSRLQPYTTTIRTSTRSRQDVDSLCLPIVGDMVEWLGGYDEAGLVLVPKEGEFIA